jgi:signal peptidase I
LAQLVARFVHTEEVVGSSPASPTTPEDSEVAVSEEVPTAPSRGRGVKLFLRDLLIILVAALVISFLIKTFLIRSFYIPSESMEPTLVTNDRILVNELVPSLVPLQRGDVVVFRDPGGWLEHAFVPDTRSDAQKAVDEVLGFVGLAAPDSDEHLIKRIIGLPGDEVVCCDAFGHLSVNGVPLEEPYIVTDAATDAVPTHFDVTVPKGRLWVLGDNRYHSADSAFQNANFNETQGFVPVDHVVGRAFVITWPTARWGFLDDYPGVFVGTDHQ